MTLPLVLEEIAELVLSMYLFSLLPYPWWLYPLLFFVPDISLAGLLVGRRIGAPVYNFIHHNALSVGLIVLGAWLAFPVISLAGVILLGHTSLDRALGLGLMEGDTFTHAHLKLFGKTQGDKNENVWRRFCHE